MEHYIELIKQNVKNIKQTMREDKIKLEAINEERMKHIDALEQIQWEMEEEISKEKV